MRVNYTFESVVQRERVKVKCPQCSKTRTLTISRTYYRNGFHNENETREKNKKALQIEREELERDGQICMSCVSINENEPITLKITPDTYIVRDRSTGKDLGKVLRHKHGSVRWEVEGHTFKSTFDGKDYPLYMHTLSEAAAYLANHDKTTT